MRERELPFRLFRFKPSWRDAAPFITWVFFAAIMQFSRIAGPRALLVLQWLRPISDLGFILIPLLWVRLVDKERLDFLGLTHKRIWWAAGLGIPLGILSAWLGISSAVMVGELPFLPSVLGSIAYFTASVFHVAACELYYRGWLSAELERSYGFGIAVLGAGFIYALSPLTTWGTDPTVPSVYLSLGYYLRFVFPGTLFMGILLSGIARLTRNLLAPFLIMLLQTVLVDLLPGGEAHTIRNPVSHLVGTLALAGIVVVVLWLTRKSAENSLASSRTLLDSR